MLLFLGLILSCQFAVCLVVQASPSPTSTIRKLDWTEEDNTSPAKRLKTEAQDSILNRYLKANPVADKMKTSALELYRYCLTLVPVQYTSAWNCFDDVDQLLLAPAQEVRLQLAYRLIDINVDGYVRFGGIEMKDQSVLPDLMQKTPWDRVQMSALLHYAAIKCRPSPKAIPPRHNAHPMFLDLHRWACRSGQTLRLEGPCLASLVTFFPTGGANPRDAFVTQVRQSYVDVWVSVEKIQKAYLNLVRPSLSDRKQYPIFIQNLNRYINMGMNIHLDWLWNSYDIACDQDLVQILIQGGIDVKLLQKLYAAFQKSYFVDEPSLDLLISAGVLAVQEPLLPELPALVLSKIGESLTGKDRALFRMASTQTRSAVKDDFVGMYCDAKKLTQVCQYLDSRKLPRTSAFSLYRFCLDNQRALIPDRFASIWACFDEVDRQKLYPSTDVRLQVLYRIIEGKIQEHGGYKNDWPSSPEMLSDLLYKTEWSAMQRAALLHNVAMSYNAYENAKFRPFVRKFFAEVHGHFCGIDNPQTLKGACLSSLITSSPLNDLPSSDAFISNVQKARRSDWLQGEQNQNELLRMILDQSVSAPTYAQLLEKMKEHIASEGSIHLDWIGDVDDDFKGARWFTAETQFGKDILGILIRAGIESVYSSHIFYETLIFGYPNRPALIDVGVAKLVLETGAELVVGQGERDPTASMRDRQKMESIPVDILAMVYSFTQVHLPICVYASITMDRAKQLLDAGITHVDSQDLTCALSLPVAVLLLDRGADLNFIGLGGYTVFQGRLMEHCDEVTRMFILSKRIKFDLQDAEGFTALHTLAERFEHAEVDELKCVVGEMKLMLKEGANPRIQDDDGKTAKDILIDLWESFGTTDPRFLQINSVLQEALKVLTLLDGK